MDLHNCLSLFYILNYHLLAGILNSGYRSDLYLKMITTPLLDPFRHNEYIQTVDPASGPCCGSLCSKMKRGRHSFLSNMKKNINSPCFYLQNVKMTQDYFFHCKVVYNSSTSVRP